MSEVDNARDKLQDILNGETYQVYYEDNRNFLEVWWNRFVQWLGELLSNLFPAFATSSGFANVVLFMVIAVVVILIGVIVFLSIRKRQRSRKYETHAPLQYRPEKNWSSSNHLIEAQQQEANENYTSATRHLFLALLLYFHEKGWLEAKSWKTNWEYYAELHQVNQHDAETFHKLAVLFDEVVYGERILQQEEYLHYRNRTMQLLQQDRQ